MGFGSTWLLAIHFWPNHSVRVSFLFLKWQFPFSEDMMITNGITVVTNNLPLYFLTKDVVNF